MGKNEVSKFDIKLRVGEKHFRNYTMYVSFQIFGSKLFFLSKTFFAVLNCQHTKTCEGHVLGVN